MNLFDYLNGMTSEKKDLNFDSDEVSKGYDSYNINRWVSMAELYLPVAAQANLINISKEENYKYYLTMLPKRKVFFNYIKKQKDTELTFEDKNYIAIFYKVNVREVDDIIKILSKEQINEILDLYKKKGISNG